MPIMPLPTNPVPEGDDTWYGRWAQWMRPRAGDQLDAGVGPQAMGTVRWARRPYTQSGQYVANLIDDLAPEAGGYAAILRNLDPSTVELEELTSVGRPVVSHTRDLLRQLAEGLRFRGAERLRFSPAMGDYGGKMASRAGRKRLFEKWAGRPATRVGPNTFEYDLHQLLGGGP